MSQRILFAHISWMPEYLGAPDEPVFSTHGYVIENKVGHERWNYKPEKGQIRGYVPIRGKQIADAPGEIKIDKLGASKSDKDVSDISVVWFANNPSNPKQAFIVGWYRKATVYREAQFRRHREFRTSCKLADATLLDESARQFSIPHVRSLQGQRLGYGYGQSSLWYADNAPESFLTTVQNYMDAVDKLATSGPNRKVLVVGDALDDLDDADVGNRKPRRSKTSGTIIVRDPEVRRRVIARAKGRCEYCEEVGFEKDDGSKFVEAHHIIHLSKQGPDTLDNVIGLCPNHHRQAHFGRDRVNFEEALKSKLRELREKN